MRKDWELWEEENEGCGNLLGRAGQDKRDKLCVCDSTATSRSWCHLLASLVTLGQKKKASFIKFFIFKDKLSTLQHSLPFSGLFLVVCLDFYCDFFVSFCALDLLVIFL